MPQAMVVSREQIDDVRARQVIAADAFDRWAASFPFVPNPPRQFVRSVDAKYECAAFLTTECEGRRIVWKEVAYRGTQRVQAAPLQASDLSPWSVDESMLRLRSDHVTLCEACSGEGKRTCGQCRGSGHFTCTSCGGSGKVYGYTSNRSRRLLNCKICRGRGAVTCPACRRGIAACETCEGEKRVQRWLEVARWHRTDETIYPGSVGEPPLSWSANADNEALERDGMVVGDVARLAALRGDDLGGIDVRWLQATSAKIANPSTPEEHIVRQRLRLVAIPRLRVSYAVGQHEGEVEFIGRRLFPISTQLQFFEQRARRLRATAVTVAIIFALFGFIYLSRGPFYWRAAGLSAVAFVGAALTSAFMIVAEATATRRRLKAWLIASAVTAIVSAVLFSIAHPTVAEARSLLARGNVAGAAEELTALTADATRAEVASAWADVHLAKAKAAQTYTDALTEAAAIPQALPQYRDAVGAADEIIRTTVERDIHQGNLAEAATVFATGSAAWRQLPSSVDAATRIYVPLATAAIEQSNWRIAAENLTAAREAGIKAAQLSPIGELLRREAIRRTRDAAEITSAARRLSARLDAEMAWIQWERATGVTSPELVALRTSMAGDLRQAERLQRLPL